jgi:hypothetical protein
VDLVVRQGLAVKRLIQVTYEGLAEPAARQRETRSLAEAAKRFPEAETLLVAHALPPDDAEEIEVPVVPFWRFLVSGGS